MGNAKYLILDFGNVIAGSPTLHWFITPNFFKYVEKDKFDVTKFNKAIKDNSKLISTKMITDEEQYQVFKKVYNNIFKEIQYDGNIEEVSKKVAYDFTYNDDLFFMFDDAKDNLKRLSDKYKLILVSDNWPCVFRIMKKWGIDKYFEKVYVSSVYDAKKEEGILFDYPIKEFNIKDNEAIFVDDHENLVDIAFNKGMIPVVMDRFEENNNCKYKKIESLNEL